ncbi:hypothetical protein Unana1_05013 [Umbelopsis nana]
MPPFTLPPARPFHRAYTRVRHHPKPSPFQILGISESSSKQQIKQRYYELCKQFHPDAAGGNTAQFQEINRAYQIVSNKSRREMYIRYGEGWEPGTRRETVNAQEVAAQTKRSILTGLGIATLVGLYMMY